MEARQLRPAQLNNLYTGNDARAAKVIRELRDKVTSTEQMRAIGFCVSVRHAHYMAEVFNRAGIVSVAVDGGTDDADRACCRFERSSQSGEINCIFAVDLFNEGLDLPQVDTILLLRPTQSATIFLQQLGRGLRRAEGKAVLTVMDFIGQQRREFRFDLRYRALTGYGRKELEKAVEDEFPYLPSGLADRAGPGGAEGGAGQHQGPAAVQPEHSWSGTSPRTRRPSWRAYWSDRGTTSSRFTARPRTRGPATFARPS